MAQKKKKGPSPKTKGPVKKKFTFSQIVFYGLAFLVVLSMLFTTVITSF